MYLKIGIDVSKNKHDACILNENGEHTDSLEKRIFAIWEKMKNKHFIQTIPGISDWSCKKIG